VSGPQQSTGRRGSVFIDISQYSISTHIDERRVQCATVAKAAAAATATTAARRLESAGAYDPAGTSAQTLKRTFRTSPSSTT
jgi:hypothetical protein